MGIKAAENQVRLIHFKEGPGQEGRHLLAVDGGIGAVIAIAAPLGNTDFRKALDVAARPDTGWNILEGRASPGTVLPGTVPGTLTRVVLTR